MKKMEFSSSWIEKVMGCIESVKFFVLINGSSHEEFRLKRGLRQGEPFSLTCSFSMLKAYECF